MELKHVVYITVDTQGALICLIASALFFLSKRQDDRLYRTLAFIELMDALMAIGDAIAWCYRGVPGDFGGFMVRAGNFLNFLSAYLVVPIFLEYVFASIEQGMTGSVFLKGDRFNGILRRISCLP